MKNICFPTDFSELSLKALPTAIELSKKLNSSLHIIHIMEPTMTIKVDQDTLFDLKQQASESKFLKIKEDLKGKYDASSIHFTSLRGNVVEKIKKYCQHSSIDLIILSTHGYSGVRRLFMGSVTNKLIQNIHIPVFTINPNTFGGDFKLENVKDILFPTDFSENSMEALNFACEFAISLGISLTLFHALSDFREWIGIYGDAYSMAGNFGSYQGYLKEQKNEARQELDFLKIKLSKKFPQLTVSVELSEGNVEQAISGHCKFDFETIIIMSTHGYSGLDHLLMGSVAERIIQTSIEPVVAFNPIIKNQALKNKEDKGELHESV